MTTNAKVDSRKVNFLSLPSKKIIIVVVLLFMEFLFFGSFWMPSNLGINVNSLSESGVGLLSATI